MVVSALPAPRILESRSAPRGELAERIGAVREVLFRNLRLLEEENILHFEERKIFLDHPEALRNIAGVSVGDPQGLDHFPALAVPAYVAGERPPQA